MNTMTDHNSIKPWYKQPWLWLVLSIPIASVILSSIMVTVAVIDRDTLVSDNYYKDGMAINQSIEQDELADSLNLQPLITVKNGAVSVSIKSDALPKQAFLTLKLLHPTKSSKDVIIKLLPTADNFVADLPAEVEGRRYLDLYGYNDTWRIREEVTLPLDNYTLNRP